MGLSEEWSKIRDTVERVVVDVTRLTTVTSHRAGGGEIARISSEVQLDGDTTTWVTGDAGPLAGCHRAAMAFTAELADARLRMIARIGKALVP